MEFLSPLGWLVACAAALPIGAALLRAGRERTVRSRLGLRPPRRMAQAATAAAAAVAIALLAAAAAQPAIRTAGTERLRTDAQVFFVVDNSRSMLARRAGGPTRFSRALAAATKIRAGLADVPAGIATLGEEPLLRLFPTGNERVFVSVLHQTVRIGEPPAQATASPGGIATEFDPLTQLGTAHYFSRRATHRIVILLSDGESGSYPPAVLARELRAEHVGLLIVRFWDARERVYRPDGTIERYRPEPGSAGPLAELAAGFGQPVFDEHQLPQVVHAARAWLGRGPTVQVGRPRRLELAPYAALVAVLPIVFLVRRRDP